MKLIKRLIVLAVLLVVLIVGVVIFAFSRIDSLFKLAVEKGGTYAMGVETKLASADVKLASGTVSMSGLTVDNPAGYKSDKFLGLGSSTIQVSPQSVSQPVIEVPTLRMSDIRVNLEKANGKANYKVILDNLSKLSGDKSSTPPKSSGSEKKFIINEVDITNVVVHVDLIPEGGQLTQVDVPIERVNLKNVGTASKGLPAGELAQVIVKAVLAVAIDKGGGLIPTDILTDLQSQLAQLGDLQSMGIAVEGKLNEAAAKTAEDLKKKADEAVQEGKKKVDETIDQAKKKFEDLIPGKK